MEQAGRGDPEPACDLRSAIYLPVDGDGVVGFGVVELALLPPQPTMATEKARTAARTANFFI